MLGLREHVALAIANDQGAGIINPREVEALMSGAKLLEDGGGDGESMARLLRAMAIDLQDKAIFSSTPRVSRVDDYYLHCADVVIAAYDQWIEHRCKTQLCDKIRHLRETGQSSGTLEDASQI